MRFVQRDVPLQWEAHQRTISFLTPDEANTKNIPMLISEEESDTLEPTNIASPSPRARHTSGKVFRTMPIGHAPSKL